MIKYMSRTLDGQEDGIHFPFFSNMTWCNYSIPLFHHTEALVYLCPLLTTLHYVLSRRASSHTLFAK